MWWWFAFKKLKRIESFRYKFVKTAGMKTEQCVSLMESTTIKRDQRNRGIWSVWKRNDCCNDHKKCMEIFSCSQDPNLIKKKTILFISVGRRQRQRRQRQQHWQHKKELFPFYFIWLVIKVSNRDFWICSLCAFVDAHCAANKFNILVGDGGKEQRLLLALLRNSRRIFQYMNKWMWAARIFLYIHVRKRSNISDQFERCMLVGCTQ